MRFRKINAFKLANAIGKKAQPAGTGNTRVKLTQAACGGVAWVGEFLLASSALAFIKALELALEHQHLTSHFKDGRDVVAMQAHRDHTHGANIKADVFARIAIPPRRSLHKTAILVTQANGKAIEL
jgi:hypothetical protein